MKKEVVITARVTVKMKEIIQSLADKDERTPAWIVRKLLTEALEAKGLLKKPNRNKGYMLDSRWNLSGMTFLNLSRIGNEIIGGRSPPYHDGFLQKNRGKTNGRMEREQ